MYSLGSWIRFEIPFGCILLSLLQVIGHRSEERPRRWRLHRLASIRIRESFANLSVSSFSTCLYWRMVTFGDMGRYNNLNLIFLHLLYLKKHIIQFTFFDLSSEDREYIFFLIDSPQSGRNHFAYIFDLLPFQIYLKRTHSSLILLFAQNILQFRRERICSLRDQ